MDLLLVLLAVVTSVYFAVIALLTIALCRAAKRGDDVEALCDQELVAALRPARPEAEREPALVSSRR